MTAESKNNPSPKKPSESQKEFDRVVHGKGSSERLVSAIKRESQSYVSNVRAGRYVSKNGASGRYRSKNGATG